MLGLPVFNCSGVIFSAASSCTYNRFAGSGVYMFVRCEPDGRRTILYIGETENLAARLGPHHEHWAEAGRLGMNEVHVHLLAETRAERLAIETRLRNLYNPRINQQGLGLLAQTLADVSPVLDRRNAGTVGQSRGLFGAFPPGPSKKRQ